ncbi:efflux RND transporter periplasmic adaptor subunit [Shewanella colwelliana]|uniref:RND transporter n=1 Tax=Shewanella colwelliana TaxID=23 RepID=A0ABQ4NXX6_SHECO|nr:efflux RND transporter periplasmic adaptor subunit [Shewanella colwelliana]MCZ4337012.1 efflux RND transporter periplasmic adaptor subunit [Shewanella colwelliana]MDX1280355.1 efflux RND transporter periplasmic adaptor subunit [Shewanella colwelliana]GIU23122.1 RND transporter [Shewanella colwelliana]GIU39575.1 RND transporter [Shewanella colwelliana]
MKVKLVVNRFVPLLCSALLLAGCSQGAVTVVEQGVLLQKVEVTGELVSADTISMMPPAIRRVWQYQVKQLAPEGKAVAKGEVVARLDTSELSQRLSVSEASLAATEQDIETSKLRNAKRMEELRLDLAEAKMNFEKAERKFKLSDETVALIEKEKYQRDTEIAKDRVVLIEQKIALESQGAEQRQAMLLGDKQKFSAEVSALKTGIASMTLKAPRAGMVVYGNDPQGNKIKEGQSVFAGDSVLSIPDLSHMQVNMTIPEVEAKRVQLGQVINIRLDANPERVFKGKIVELGAVFRNKNQDVPLVVFDAVASIDEPDSELMRPGMAAKISIDIAQGEAATLLATEAVHFDAGQAYVFRPSLFGARKQVITLADIGSERVSISQGLSVGDEVLLP